MTAQWPANIDHSWRHQGHSPQKFLALGATVPQRQEPGYSRLKSERTAVGENLKNVLLFARVVRKHGNVPVPRIPYKTDYRQVRKLRWQVFQMTVILKHPGTRDVLFDQLIEEGPPGAGDVNIDEVVSDNQFAGPRSEPQ